MTQPGIKAVIFDMGGVLLRTEDRSPREIWEAHLNLAPGRLDAEVFDCPEAKLAGIGKANKGAIWKAVGERLGVAREDLIRLESDFWSGDQIDRDLLAYILTLRKGYKTAILSNAWPEARGMLENRYQVGPFFDLIIISAEEGVAKPDLRIYRIASSRLGLEPHECVFIDDFVENIEGARQSGMHAVRFLDTRQVIADLDKMLSA